VVVVVVPLVGGVVVPLVGGVVVGGHMSWLVAVSGGTTVPQKTKQ
jgi:hypothetical protein